MKTNYSISKWAKSAKRNFPCLGHSFGHLNQDSGIDTFLSFPVMTLSSQTTESPSLSLPFSWLCTPPPAIMNCRDRASLLLCCSSVILHGVPTLQSGLLLRGEQVVACSRKSSCHQSKVEVGIFPVFPWYPVSVTVLSVLYNYYLLMCPTPPRARHSLRLGPPSDTRFRPLGTQSQSWPHAQVPYTLVEQLSGARRGFLWKGLFVPDINGWVDFDLYFFTGGDEVRNSITSVNTLFASGAHTHTLQYLLHRLELCTKNVLITFAMTMNL